MIVRTHAIIFRYVYRIVVFSFIRHQLGGKLQMPLVMVCFSTYASRL